MTKYKYYFRKPRSEIVKDIFRCLATAGALYIAASSPYFVLNVMREFKKLNRYDRRKVSNAFSRLKREGCIVTTRKNRQIYISLTEKGRKKAGWLQIDELQIRKPKKWDKKWRIVIFDIAQLKKLYREAFRGKLKELGFRPLQKSVWIHPFDCRDELALLKDFFGLSDKELRLLTAESIGNDAELREKFHV